MMLRPGKLIICGMLTISLLAAYAADDPVRGVYAEDSPVPAADSEAEYFGDAAEDPEAEYFGDMAEDPEAEYFGDAAEDPEAEYYGDAVADPETEYFGDAAEDAETEYFGDATAYSEAEAAGDAAADLNTEEAGTLPDIPESAVPAAEECADGNPGEQLSADDSMTGLQESAAESAAAQPAGSESGAAEAVTGESLVPADRVTEDDLRLLLRSTEAEEWEDTEIDAVSELLALYPEDTGILQMAAENSGKTEEAAADAALAVSAGAALDEVTGEALENAGITGAEGAAVTERAAVTESAVCAAEPLLAGNVAELFSVTVHADDRISGRALEFVPSDSPEEAMASVSSLALIRKKDGSGDWDREGTYEPEGDGFDWSGSDSSDHNGVVRTNDDVTYLMAYSTSLADRYMYNTIRGTRLYVSYTLPLSEEEAVFNTDAMPWMKGDGPDGKPVLTVGDGVQTLTGYRDLPDREDPDGNYDVPGAGTVNCVIHVKAMKSRQAFEPSFRAWIARASSNEEAPADAVVCDTSRVTAEVRATCGAYVAVKFRKPASNELSCYLTWKSYRSQYADGSFREKNGRLKQFPFVITAGKPNGSLKGADRIDRTRRIRVFMTCEASSPEGAATDAGVTDLVTRSMLGDDGRPACFRSGDNYACPNGDSVRAVEPYSDVSGRITDAGVSDGQFWFDIEGFGNEEPGSVLSAGWILVNQEQAQTSRAREHYAVTLTAEKVFACSASGDGKEEVFSQSYTDGSGAERRPSCTIESEVDSSGGWDAHLLLTDRWNSNSEVITGGRMSTAGVTGYGGSFGAMASQWHSVNSAAASEQSKEWFILWDNTKLELAEQDGSGFREQQCALIEANGGGEAPVRYVYITKADGSVWQSREEMLNADLRSFRDLRFWPDYASAASHGAICGVLCECWDFRQEIGTKRDYDFFSAHLKTREDPSVIGTAAMITFSIATYTTNIKKTSSFADASDGMGSIPDLKENPPVRLWNMSLPRTYSPTEWDSSGAVIPSSIVPHNSVHEGNTVYISGYGLKIEDRLEDGLEAETFDLSEKDRIGFRIEAAFTNTIPVSGAGAVIYSPDPVTDEGTSPVLDQSISILSDDGSKIPAVEGTVYEMSRFLPGAPGTFVMTRGSLSEIYNGRELTGDPLDGKSVLIVPADDPSLALTPAEGGTADKTQVVLEKKAGESGSGLQRWKLTRVQDGTYNLKNESAGRSLHVESGKAESGAAADIISAGSEDQSVQWTARKNSDGSWNLFYMKSGSELMLKRDGAPPSPGEKAVLAPASEEGSGRWMLVSTGDSEPHGTVISFEGLSSEYPFPVFLKEYTLDKTAVTSDTTLTDTAMIAGDGLAAVQSKANLHLGASSASFTETSSDVLKMTADRETLRNGEELEYTIRYTNQYDREHHYRLTDLLPSPDEFAETSEGVRLQVPEDMAGGFAGKREDYPSDEAFAEAQRTYAEELLTHLAGGSASYKEGTLRADTNLGSPVQTGFANSTVSAEGSLKPGETLTVKYSVSIKGALPDDRIRNSCMVVNDYGTVYSNRTETRVGGTPASEGPVLPLMTGGPGGGESARTAALAAALLTALVYVYLKNARRRRSF